MGAISANVPAIQLVTGPMLTGSHGGRRVGACTDCRSYWKMFRADEIDLEEIWRVNDQLVPTVGVSFFALGGVCLFDENLTLDFFLFKDVRGNGLVGGRANFSSCHADFLFQGRHRRWRASPKH
jgi:hypothetical protein